MLLVASPASAKDPPAPARAQVEFFEKHVRPVLVENCYSCHSEAKGKKKGGLFLDSRAGLLKGGDSGPALVPGKPAASLVIKAVRHESPDLKMPPKGKLADAQLAALVRWVQEGAVWPGVSTTGTARAPGKITDEDRRWWAFQPVKEVAPPKVADAGWARTPIDQFIWQRLRAEGLQPSPPAQRPALVRRLYFDLVGLPPTPQEVEAFVADPAADAYERLVDRLLASPRYGERWARHWLDLVRYAESDGYRIDDYRTDAWRYRDYVIRAFNADKPYDRFVQEQLAGDELAPDDPDALTATGFLRLWIYEYNQRDVRTQWDIIQNDLTDVTSDVFLGLGMGCARCHDHKFDPILQHDYYRLQAFFATILPRDDLPLASPQQRADYQAQRARWEAEADDVLRQIDLIEKPIKEQAARGAIAKFPEEIQEMIRKPVAQRTPLEHQLAELAYRQVLFEYTRLDAKLKDPDKQKLIALRKQLVDLGSRKPAPLPAGLTVTDAGPVAPPTRIPKKANTPPIEPGYLTLLDEKPAVIPPVPGQPNTTGRRLALARWLTRPEHPLTARVIVNRVWQYHFGQGLVATSSDFGRLGEPPSHPELLDWLARRFVQDGWSLKKLHRLLVTSATYRQAAVIADLRLQNADLQKPAAPANLQSAIFNLQSTRDPENRLLWKMPTRRLDAEQIRDAILAATGELDLTAGGPSVDTSRPRRTIYTRATRNTRDPLLDVFDAPENFSSTPQRNVTTTPTQALLLINSTYMAQRGKALAERLQQAAPDPGQRIDLAFRLTFGRPPTPAERQKVLAFLGQQDRGAPAAVTAADFQSEKMPYREGRAALVQPGGKQAKFQVADAATLPDGDFTIEAFVLLRSLYDDASVRTIAARWNGDRRSPGWSLGVTSRKSAFKPQTLVLQLAGEPGKDGDTYEAVFSGLHIALNKPYFVAVSVKLGDPEKKGVTFYAKDLSNDDEPMQSVRCAHELARLPKLPATPLTLGGRTKISSHSWDGLIDDVRLSRGVLAQEQLLLTSEVVTERTAGYWQFELRPGVFKDVSGHGHDIEPPAQGSGIRSQGSEAWIDFCQVLLNANEFLYVD